jgi:peptidoglycan L-alanyl-D-glutamate endopeptidase CwlK
MINSRDIAQLHPKVQVLCKKFIAACDAEGIDVLITSTYRDGESQNALYEQGRTTKGAIVTNARAGQSFHNWRVAFDFVPIVNGKAQWDDLLTFTRCGMIAESVGLEWAGRWKRFKELAHCQQTFGYSLSDFQAGKTL